MPLKKQPMPMLMPLLQKQLLMFTSQKKQLRPQLQQLLPLRKLMMPQQQL
jgi:hypothetical protein